MFSSDQNIETIGQLVEVLKHYVGLQTEYVKLDIVDKVVRLLTVAVMTAILSLLLLMVAIFVSFAVASALQPLVGTACAYGIVAVGYLLLLLLVCIFRHRWIERPLVKFLASLLLEK